MKTPILSSRVLAEVERVIADGDPFPERAEVAALPDTDRANYYRALAERAYAWCAAAERRRRTPAREEFDELIAVLERTRREKQILQARLEEAERRADRLEAEGAMLKAGTRVPYLEEEVERWKERWRAAVRRVGDHLEHGGWTTR